MIVKKLINCFSIEHNATLLYNKMIYFNLYRSASKLSNGERKLNIKAVIAAAFCLIVVAGLIIFDAISSRKEYTANDVAMNTVISIKLFGSDGEKTADEVKDCIRSVETSLLSRYKSGSDVSRINSGNSEAVSVSPDVEQIISKSVEVSKECGGVFDITVGKITELWGFGGDKPQVPDKAEIEELLPYVGYSKMDVTGSSVKLGSNQTLDLGAVGKGAACDIVKSFLSETRTDSAVISVGGSLLLYGKRNFTIGIMNPENDKDYMGTLKLSDTCVSTSGDYEQTFEKDGKTYHHILNALTGYPADSHLKSVTVVCESGILSDALSTACFILGYGDSSLNLLKKFDAEAVFITSDKIVRCTDGIKNSFTLTDDSYTLGK